jgi:hypothetical protein
MWFETLVGFREISPADVRKKISIENGTMVSAVNHRRMSYGKLTTPSLSELRLAAEQALRSRAGRLQVSEVVADVQDLHVDPANAGALFQVASQFNLLEMVAPSYVPEDGVGIYENDFTQGPACAIACGAGTIFRNYFAPVEGETGQSFDRQIDCLRDVGVVLGNENDHLWEMKNGYALATAAGLVSITQHLNSISEDERDEIRSALRIGLQVDTEVTIGNSRHSVAQAYCSAMPVAYSQHSSKLWAGIAGLILEAAYEATLCAGVINATTTGNHQVFLTLLGGGAFGNDDDWILGGVARALDLFRDTDLSVSVVSFGRSNSHVASLANRYQ